MSHPEPPPFQPEPAPGFPSNFQPEATQGHPAGQHPVPPHPGHNPGQGAPLPRTMPYEGQQPPVGPGLPPAPQFYNLAAPRPSKKLLWIGLGSGFAAGVIATVLVAGIAGALSAAGGPSFQKAADSCNAAHTSGISLGDKGSSITIDTKGEEDTSGASMDDAACILNALDVPDSVISQMDDTSAMDGRQTASWAGVNASWTYHPDNGVKLILTRAEK